MPLLIALGHSGGTKLQFRLGQVKVALEAFGHLICREFCRRD